MSNLIKGIEGGLTDLFETMTSISWSVASAQVRSAACVVQLPRHLPAARLLMVAEPCSCCRSSALLSLSWASSTCALSALCTALDSLRALQDVPLLLPEQGQHTSAKLRAALMQVGNVALMEVVTPRLTSVAIFLQNSLAG